MKRTVGRAVVLTAVALALATSPAAGATFWDAPTGASAAGGPSAISYFEEIPCPPTAGDPGRRQKVRHRVRRKHPHVVKAKVVKPAVARPVVRPVVKRVAPAHPVVRRVVHKKPRKPAAPRLVRAAAVTLPKRCTVLHRDRLTFASLPLAREASDFSAAPDPVGVATGAVGSGAPGHGRAALCAAVHARQRRRRPGNGDRGERRA